MPLTGPRVLVRESTLADWPAYRRIWEDFSRSEYAQYDLPGEAEPERAKALLSRLLASGRFVSVCLVDTGEMIGYLCLHGDASAPELGYCFHSAFHGHGYAREACRLLIEECFAKDASRVTAGTALNNAPSVRLLRRLGFQLTGTEQVSFYRDAQDQPIWFTGGLFELRR